jgi:hypothetical protein
MNLQSVSKGRRQQGTAMLVLLSLLTIAAILFVSNHMALRRLQGELSLIESRQNRKFIPLRQTPPGETNPVESTNISTPSVR